MNIKPTIVVFILAALSAVAAIYTHNSDRKDDRKTNGVRTLLTSEQFPGDAVRKITLNRSDDEPIVFSRTDDGWSQSEPFTFKMDPFSMRQLLILPAQVMVSQEIDSSQQTGSLSAKELSLDPPIAELIYEWGDEQLKMQFGRRSVAGRWYVRIAGHEQIYIATGDLYERAVAADPKEWRDRTIFTNASVNSDKVIVNRGTNQIELIRDKKQWKMNIPVKTRLDDVAMDEIFRALTTAKSGGFIVDQPGSLSEFGLAEPKVSVTVNWTEVVSEDNKIVRNSKHETLLIGASKGIGSGDRFGMMQGQDVVFILPEKMRLGMLRNANTIVARTASGVLPANIKAIEINTPQGMLRLERVLERWTAPQHHVNVPAHYVNNFLTNLTDLKAPEIELRPYPSELEVATVTFIGFDSFPIDAVRIAYNPDTKKWALENGDNVLRVFPDSLELRLTPADYGIKPLPQESKTP